MISDMDFDGTPLPLPSPARFDAPFWSRRLAERDASLATDRFAGPVLKVLYDHALIRNAWGTTNIDGAPIEVRRVGDLLEAHGRGAAHLAGVLPTEREVLHYFDLLSDLPRDRWALSVDDIQAAHRAYFQDVPLDNRAAAGQWKVRPNFILGPGNHVSPTTAPSAVVTHLEQLCGWWNDLADPLPADVALFFHAFQRIHPFADGNGRVARLLTLQLLSSLGLENIRFCPVDDHFHREREEYLASLFEADLGRPTRWLGLFHVALADGYRRAELLGRRLQRIPPDHPDEAVATLAWAILRGRRMFTAREVAHIWSDATGRTQRRHLSRLQEEGSLEAWGRTRGRAYKLAPGFLTGAEESDDG